MVTREILIKEFTRADGSTVSEHFRTIQVQELSAEDEEKFNALLQELSLDVIDSQDELDVLNDVLEEQDGSLTEERRTEEQPEIIKGIEFEATATLTPFANDRIPKYADFNDRLEVAITNGDQETIDQIYDVLEEDIKAELTNILGKKRANAIEINRARGVWQGGSEPSFFLQFPELGENEKAAIAHIGNRFDQDEVHVQEWLENPQGNYLEADDGSYETLAAVIELNEGIDPQTLAGVFGGVSVLGDNTFLAYQLYTPDEEYGGTIEDFNEKLVNYIDENKESITGYSVEAIRLTRYSRDSKAENTQTYQEALSNTRAQNSIKDKFIAQSSKVAKERSQNLREQGLNELSSIEDSLNNIDDISQIESALANDINNVFRAGGNVALAFRDKVTQKLDLSQVQGSTGTLPNGETYTVKAPNVISADLLEGKRGVFTISDKLGTGNKTDIITGETITNLHGGLGYNLTDIHADHAWANISEEEARTNFLSAQALYEQFPEEFPNGHVPMFVVRMGEDSIDSNEAMFRVLANRIKGNTTKGQRQKGYDYIKDNIPKIEDLALQNEYVESFADSEEPLLDMLNNVTQLPAGRRKAISDLAFIGSSQITEPGYKSSSSKIAGAMFGKATPEQVALLNKSNISISISDPISSQVPQRHIFAMQEVKVANEDGSLLSVDEAIVETQHPNYPIGIKGRHVGVFDESVHVSAVLPEAYANQIFHSTTEAIKTSQGSLIQNANSATTLPGQLAFKGSGLTFESDEGRVLQAYLRLNSPRTNVVQDQERWDELVNSDEFDPIEYDGDIQYGVLEKDGNIYLNPELSDTNAPVRAFGHLWIDYLENTKNDLYQEGIKLASSHPTFGEFSKKYPDNDIKARQETLAQAIVSSSERLINSAKQADSERWLDKVSNYVREVIPNTFASGDSWKEDGVKINDFINSAISQIFSGQEAGGKLKDIKATRADLSDELRERLASRYNDFQNLTQVVGTDTDNNSFKVTKSVSSRTTESLADDLRGADYYKDIFDAKTDLIFNKPDDDLDTVTAFDGLTREENTAVHMYTSDVSEINSRIRNNTANKADEAFIEILDRALEKLPTFDISEEFGGGILRRGIELDDRHIDQYVANVGGIVEYKSYTSTSVDTEFGKPVKMYINPKKNSSGKHIAQISEFNEGEVLFPRNTRFKIQRVLVNRGIDEDQTWIYLDEV